MQWLILKVQNKTPKQLVGSEGGGCCAYNHEIASTRIFEPVTPL